jgi:diketogulonate reductase-like aldo/keto reductase
MNLLHVLRFQSKPGEVEAAVRTALDIGYRLIDTASAYGNEAEIGAVLHEYITNGKLKREDVFVTTKVSTVGTRRPDRAKNYRT